MNEAQATLPLTRIRSGLYTVKIDQFQFEIEQVTTSAGAIWRIRLPAFRVIPARDFRLLQDARDFISGWQDARRA